MQSGGPPNTPAVLFDYETSRAQDVPLRLLDGYRGYLMTDDNNRAENAIRPFVIDCKNWLFSDTPNGATASAQIYSLIETAEANGQEPYAWLRHVLERLPSVRNVEDYEALLPWNCLTTTHPDREPSLKRKRGLWSAYVRTLHSSVLGGDSSGVAAFLSV